MHLLIFFLYCLSYSYRNRDIEKFDIVRAKIDNSIAQKNISHFWCTNIVSSTVEREKERERIHIYPMLDWFLLLDESVVIAVLTSRVNNKEQFLILKSEE